MAVSATRLDANPLLQPWVRWAVLAAILVQLIGVGLLIAPEAVMARWPWKVPQFNARFLGAIYLAQAAASLPLLVLNRWSPGRVALLAAFLFTAIASVGSVLYAGEFLPGKRTPLWFVLYIGYAFITGYALFSNREKQSPAPLPVDGSFRRIVSGLGIGLIGYGVAMFLMPAAAAAFWPWPVNAMHGSIYSALFVAVGAAATLTARDGAPEEWLSLGLFLLVFGAAALLGLYLADQALNRVVWDAPGTLLWAAILLAIAVIGSAAIRLAMVAVPEVYAPRQ